MTTRPDANPTRPDRTGHAPGVAGTLLTVVFLVALCSTAHAQRQDFSGWEEMPGLYFYLVQPAEAWRGGTPTVLRSVTRDRVAGANALRLDFPDVNSPAGVVVYRPPGYAIFNRIGYRGITFWVKGDGSTGSGVIAIGKGKDTDPRAFFRLSGKTWQPVRLRWDDFDRRVPKAQIESFTFGITPETKRPAHYIVDRIQLVREPKPSVDDDAIRAAGMKAARDPEPRRPKDLAKFVSGRGKLAPVVDLLKAKKPVRVLLIGDSLAQAGTLWNVPDGVRPEHLFWGRLQRRFGREDRKGNVRVMIAASPVDAAGRLPALLDRLKPQLVVLQFSSSPPEPGKLGVETRNRAAAVRLIDQVTRAGVPTIAVPVPSLPGPVKHINTAEMLTGAASARNVPVADFGKLVAARGPGWQGEYYATPDQLNIQGHWLLADLLSQALGEPKPEQHDEKDKK